MIEVLFPVGRLVSGHPMDAQAVKDKSGVQKVGKDNKPMFQFYAGVAIPKGSEQHWNQTEWGGKIYQAAQDAADGYTNGEIRHPTFSWKITDGDSDIPNKKGNVPREQEGWAGHWVVHFSTQIPYGCYHVGRYEPQQAIQRAEEIKRGDYCRIFATVKGNKPSETPGVYINPTLFELSRAGVEIIGKTSGPAASDVFGQAAPVLPAGAQVDTAVSAPAPQPAAAAPQPPVAAPAPVPTPAHDLVQPGAVGIAPPAPPAPPAPVAEEAYIVNGQRFTKSQLVASGYTDAHFVTLQRA